jgi:hypothetical protein
MISGAFDANTEEIFHMTTVTAAAVVVVNDGHKSSKTRLT